MIMMMVMMFVDSASQEHHVALSLTPPSLSRLSLSIPNLVPLHQIDTTNELLLLSFHAQSRRRCAKGGKSDHWSSPLSSLDAPLAGSYFRRVGRKWESRQEPAYVLSPRFSVPSFAACVRCWLPGERERALFEAELNWTQFPRDRKTLVFD